MADQEIDVTIIGAGWYGLVAARTYLRLRPTANVLILDNDNSVGGVWSKDRLYPNLVAQVKLGLFNYSDMEMPPDPKHKDKRVTGAMIHNYMQRYAEDHDLIRRIRFNAFVENAKRSSKGWQLTIRGSPETIETKKLMVCTGVTSIPTYAKFNGVDVSVPIVHSRDLGVNFEMLGGDSIKHVIVVGAAKSAYDAVYLLLSMGKHVTWVIRPNGAGPLAILPSKVLGLVSSIAVASTRLMTYLSPSILNTTGSLYWAFQKSMPGLWAVGTFWDTLAKLSDHHAGYDDGDHISMLRPEIERQSIFWANSGLGVVTLPDFWRTMHEGKLTIVRDTIQSIKQDTVVLNSSGELMQTDAVVMCTGWGDHFGMFDADTKLDLGLPVYPGVVKAEDPSYDTVDTNWDIYDREADKSVDEKLPFLSQPPKLAYPATNEALSQRKWRLYRRCIPIKSALRGDRSIAIMGQIHTVQTPLVAEVQSFWSILYLLGELQLPDEDAMAREISEWNAWTRKRYLSQGQKFPYSLYDFMPYIDTLFADLGLSSRRKGNALSELFSPYEPRDFEGFVDEYLSQREEEQVQF